ncbi:MAG: dTDP-4-dehydrorhamnose reductase [Bacteroidales bacterium]
MKHILVTGSNGQLGSEIRAMSEQFPQLMFYFTDLNDLDICNQEAIRLFLQDKPLDYIINCAAYTAVDKAETDCVTCSAVNADAPVNLAEAARIKGARMIHVSTDYVYSGNSCRPYRESDPTAPVSVYGITKLEGEKRLFEECSEALVLRTSWLYSGFGNNFVKTMMRLGRERDSLGVIFDQVGTPTYARDLASVILRIIAEERFQNGIYNFSNEGVCSWYDFALKIHQLAGISGCHVRPLQTEEYPTPAKRPYYSVMDKKKFRDTFEIEIPHWEESLRECVRILL